MPEYTWDDWYYLRDSLKIEFNPRNIRAYDNANSMLKYYMDCRYSAYPEAHKRCIKVMFDMLFEDLPTIVNEVINIKEHVYLLVYKIAEWRLIIGK